MDVKDVLQLQQPLTDGAIRTVNFFNGRLLSAKDLTREQTARREADARLGRAIGDGVAYGLEVARDAGLDTAAAPVLRVKAGLAVNRAGRTLRLAADVSVALTRRFGAGESGCVFANCTPLVGGTYIAGAGVYLLTIAPAQTSEGRAATNGLDPTNVAWIGASNIFDLRIGAKTEALSVEGYVTNLGDNSNFANGNFGNDALSSTTVANKNEIRLWLPNKRAFGIRASYNF